MTKTPTAQSLKQTFDRRSFVVGAVQGGFGVLLAARMGYLAVAQNERYKMESESNRVNLSLIPPRRGWILDRNGAPLASNKADFRIDIIPERLEDREGVITKLSSLLKFTSAEELELRAKLEDAKGFQPIAVASNLGYDAFAAISVRLPELPGVVPQHGYSRHYPTGPAVGHLIGYVGTASREDYELEPTPLLVTPGFKLGKDGLEKQFEQTLRGQPGARRVEVTASGRIVRDLDMRDDVQGKPIQLTIDGPLQDYAARRLGLESGSAVVMDCVTGDLLCMSSMPSFDPNSFSDGIGRIEYQMLSEDDHVPLRNKTLKGLYPPGSTVKPMVAMAFLEAGLDPKASVHCSGGLRVGNRTFHCWNRRGHGHTDMAKGVYQSCDVYFYYFAQKLGMDIISVMAKRCGMGQEFPLPVASQFYGTVPDPAWKLNKYGTKWQPFDTVNATIGQGYMLSNPLQLAVMAARLATGRTVMPRLILDDGPAPVFKSMGFDAGHVKIMQDSMSDVVNGPGTANRAKLPLDGILMAGKTGTAQVVSLSKGSGKSGPWKYRDHGLFIWFAPFDKPRYAGAVVIEHGGGSGSAYPIARDIATFLFDPMKGLDALHGMEKQWGGTAQERMARKYASYASAAGLILPKVPENPFKNDNTVDAEARAGPLPKTPETQAIEPSPETSSEQLSTAPAALGASAAPSPSAPVGVEP